MLMRSWYKKNREKILAKQREARAAIPEKFRAYHRRWRSENREADHRHCAAWAKRNPEKCVARVRRWQLANPERYKAQQQRARARARARKVGGEQITLPLASSAAAPASARETPH